MPRLFKPSSEKLLQEITQTEAEVARLQAELDQAEAAAVAAALDPDMYDKAAAQASERRGQLAVQDERLGRLRRARDEALRREQSAYVAKLEKARAGREADRERLGQELRNERETEEKRHREALESFNRRENDARRAADLADAELENARAGLSEHAAGLIHELEAAINEAYHRFGGDDLDRQYQDARAALSLSNGQLREIESLKSSGADYVESARRERDEAKKTADELSEQRHRRNSEIEGLRRKIADLKSAAGCPQ